VGTYGIYLPGMRANPSTGLNVTLAVWYR
jgi:hypothetical protein